MPKIKNSLFYKKAIDEYGVCAQGVHWNSKYTQYKRFEMLTKFIKKEIVTSSIVDAGCGFGEYYNYLIKNNKKPKSYIGIDCEQYMIDVSKKRHPFLKFEQTDILNDELQQADYYIASGSLNILDFDDVKQFITKCFNASNKGFIFNFLKDDTFTNVSKDDIVSICNLLTNDLKIKDNYLQNDFTVYLR